VDISADSFNNSLRAPIKLIIEGDPSDVQTGYGFTMTSQPIVRDPITNLYPLVDDTQWDDLRLDIIKARTHQSGVPVLTDVAQGDLISTAVFGEYLTLVQLAIANKDEVAVGQYSDVVPPTLVNPQLQVSFSNFAYHRTSVAWNDATEANQFFNAGGGFLVSFAFNNSIPGPAGNQGREFGVLASQMGSRFFGLSQWRNSTSNWNNFAPIQTSSNGNYSGNTLQFLSRLNTSSSNDAAQLTFEIRMFSDYTGEAPSGSGAGSISYGDQVTGSTDISILQRQAVNSITSPTPVAWAYDALWTVGAGPITYP
jgi:hypothetical protein